jgi:hypothetical protein
MLFGAVHESNCDPFNVQNWKILQMLKKARDDAQKQPGELETRRALLLPYLSARRRERVTNLRCQYLATTGAGAP